jgi:hydrogenase maturation protein HypF
VIEVQHHHAHIASSLDENGEAGPVIGLALDGFGLGPDGTIWGGEMLIADRRDFSRAGHLSPVPQPGGDRAAREPWRMAVSHLHAVYGEDSRDGSFRRRGLPFLGAIDGARLEAVAALVRTPGASPVTTSAGRLFDAVAAITGLCLENRFEGEAAMALEAAMGEDAEGDAGGGDEEAYLAGDDVVARGAALELRTAPLIRGVVLDVLRGVEPARVSRRFHHSLAALLAAGCAAVRARRGLDTVALGGGVFQNACLARETARRLERLGFRVLRHRRVPASDNGLALGQAAVAAARLLAARR